MLVAVAAMVPLVVDQVQELIRRVPGWLDQVSVYTKRWFDVELTGEKILKQVTEAQQNVAQLASNVASVGQFILGPDLPGPHDRALHVLLVADAPRFRRTVCSVLPPRRQHEILAAWEIAVDKTGLPVLRLLLAAISSPRRLLRPVDPGRPVRDPARAVPRVHLPVHPGDRRTSRPRSHCSSRCSRIRGRPCSS